jgi:peptide/nickel transport system substrate-binding protein
VAAILVSASDGSRPGVALDRRQFLLASMGAATSMALALAGCTTVAGGRGVHLTDGALGFPSPFAANGGIGYTQMSYVYDALLWEDASGQLLPWLAQSFTVSPDNLLYTFVLRDGVRWSDGKPVTVDDVVFTFDYYAKQNSLSPSVIFQPPKGIASVRMVDQRQVQVALTAPRVTFPRQVAAALPIIPRHVWARIADPGSAQSLKVLVGSGPYRVASYHQDGGPLLFTARNDFFLGRPFMQRVEYRAIDDALGALLSGNADIAYQVGLRPDILSRFVNNPTYGMVSNKGSSANVLYWNLGKEGPLADVRVRRAMVMAIDRQNLVDRIISGRGQPGSAGFLAPTNPFYSPVADIPFDVAGANALLDAAGYHRGSGGLRQGPNGAALSYALLIDNARGDLAEVLVGDLKRVGVELRPNEVTIGPRLFGSKLTGNYDMAVLPFPGPGPGDPNADPDTLRLLFSSRVGPSLQGASPYANRTFDDLADQQQVTFDETQRKAIVGQMQTILAEDIPVYPLYYADTDAPFRKQVLDQWYFTPNDFPSWRNNKQLMVTGRKTGTTIRTV